MSQLTALQPLAEFSMHCQSHVHCKTCRDKINGREWRESVSRHFGIIDADWLCPAGISWDNESCLLHTDWCGRFGLPTGTSGCAACSAAEGDDRVWLLTQLRAIGGAYAAMLCYQRYDSGQTEERICCGGQVKAMPIFNCRLTGARADCDHCLTKGI